MRVVNRLRDVTCKGNEEEQDGVLAQEARGAVHHGEHQDFGEAVEQPRDQSPEWVLLPPPFDSLKGQLHQLTMLMDHLTQDHHNDRNEVISSINDLQHNKW